ncbi:Apolipoprotein B-100 [Takifugu flavidus]|uniref:Apolipoprotein B-100 n=1 Tax=Takifugu flavidus TaxID=433684 RepID=A0A5C6NX65_9TELE|nr:Apolipoprotein B-100 [Takifugu flavidus]
MEGKVTPQEASLYALLAGRAYDATTRNHVNVVLNGRALSITSNAMGAIKELTTENSHSLTLTLWTLTLESQTKNFLHKDVYYNHNSKVDMKPFLLSFALTNNLKIHEVIFSNGGYMKLEPFKVDLRGSMRGAHRGDHSFTHVYSLSYDNNYGTAKYNTTGIVSNAQLNHKCNLAFAGFTWASNCDVRIISDPLRFASAVRAVAVPFRLTVDAFARSDTDIHLQGNHTGQLDSTLLLTAEPLALAYSHHSQLESLHMLQSENISTNAENKVSGLLTPTDQSLTWTVKSKLNNSTYSQDVSLYNNPKIIGFNVSCLLLTDVLGKYTKTNYSGRGVEELSMTVGLTYEKSRACYIAGSPFIESFADALEQIKDTTIQALVSLQRYIQGLNIHQIIVDAKVKLMELPKRVRDFVQELVSEKKINQVKTKVDFFMKEFMVTVEDLESGMKIFWKKLENTIADVSGRLETLTVAVRGYITSGHFAAKVTAVLAQAGRQLQAFEMKYNIKQSLIKVLDAVQEFFKHTEMLPEWLKTADSKCKMSERFRNKTLGVKQTIETFDLISFSQAVEEGTKISDALRKLEKVIETTIYNDIKIKVLDILEDVRERISNMDIREEIYFYLHRASMFYSNMVAFISVQLGQLLDRLKYLGKNDRFIGHMKEAATGVLEGLTGAEIKVPTFVVPLTDLVVPGFTLHLNRLHELQIPAQISVPEFTILNRYKIPGCTIDFDRFKSRIILVIEAIKRFEIQMPDPEAIFGELKMLYLFQLPDLTFPEITLSEITFPAMHIPTLNLTDFQIEMPPVPEMEASEISSDSCSATFGKLRGEFQVNFPQYALVTTGKMANFTSALRNPQFTGSVTSRATSPLEFLEHSFEATASLENLLFTETMKATHTTFSIDHQGSLTVTQGSTEASAHTWTKVTTQIYRSDLANRMTFALGSAVHVAVHTAWDYSLFIAATDTVSLGTVKHELAAIIQTDQLSISSETSGNGQWSVQGYGDEGTHTSNIRFKASFQSAELYFAGKTDSQVMRLNHSLMAQSADWRHLLVQARYETDVPFATKSIVDISGEAHPLDSKAALLISHSAEFTGNVIGSMENEVEVSLQGFEIVLNVENKVKAKILLPLKMTGKVALQQAHRALLMPERQWYNWVALASFNHYHYNSNVTAENNKMELYLHVSASGEANLGFLTVPLSVPNITVPFLEIETPRVQGLSLWDYAGFKTLLSTPRQSFQINRKLIYYKTTDKDSVQVSRKPY